MAIGIVLSVLIKAATSESGNRNSTKCLDKSRYFRKRGILSDLPWRIPTTLFSQTLISRDARSEALVIFFDVLDFGGLDLRDDESASHT